MNESSVTRRLTRRGALRAASAAAGLALVPTGLLGASAGSTRASSRTPPIDLTYLKASNADLTYFVCCAGAAEIPLHNSFDKRYNAAHPGVMAKAQYLP